MAKVSKRDFRRKNNVVHLDPVERKQNKKWKQAREDFNETLTQLYEEEMLQEYEAKEEALIQAELEDWGMGNG